MVCGEKTLKLGRSISNIDFENIRTAYAHQPLGTTPDCLFLYVRTTLHHIKVYKGIDYPIFYKKRVGLPVCSRSA